jgi:invasion protein IalB
MHALAFVSAVLLSAGTAAAAQTQPPVQPQATPKDKSAADQVICEREQDTGSRLGAHKICHTRAQWDDLRRDDRSAVEHVQSQRSMDQNGH